MIGSLNREYRNVFTQANINYAKRYIKALYLFGTKTNCHKNGKNPLLFQFTRKAIRMDCSNWKKFLSCLLRLKLIRTYFYRE